MTRSVTGRAAFALTFALVLAASSTGTAVASESTRYVIDFLVVTVRSQPGEWAEVVSRLSSGDSVELTGEIRDGYARVVLPDQIEVLPEQRIVTFPRLYGEALPEVVVAMERRPAFARSFRRSPKSMPISGPWSCPRCLVR